MHDSIPTSIIVELESMLDEDQNSRQEFLKLLESLPINSDKAIAMGKNIHEADCKRMDRLKVIIDLHGWPKISQCGVKAAEAAFCIIQHADALTRDKYYPIFMKIVEMGEGLRSNLATMEDRMLVQSGKKQKYGTQFRRVDGIDEMYPIENPENVNQLRERMGLGKLSLQVVFLNMAMILSSCSCLCKE